MKPLDPHFSRITRPSSSMANLSQMGPLTSWGRIKFTTETHFQCLGPEVSMLDQAWIWMRLLQFRIKTLQIRCSWQGVPLTWWFLRTSSSQTKVNSSLMGWSMLHSQQSASSTTKMTSNRSKSQQATTRTWSLPKTAGWALKTLRWGRWG